MAVTAHVSQIDMTPENQWATKVYTFGPYAAAALPDGNYPLFTTPEACDIVKITVRNTTPSAAASDTIVFKVAASGTAPTSGTAITAVEDSSVWTANTPFDVALGESGSPHKDIASGSVVSLTTAGTLASTAGLIITIVTRRKPLRRGDATGVNVF